MSESVQLVQMKHRLSGDSQLSTSTPKPNGVSNGHAQLNGTAGKDVTVPPSPTTPVSPIPNYKTGFIANKEYGDWDTSTSPHIDANTLSVPSMLPRQPVPSRTSSRPTQRFIPEHDIEVPADGSLRDFNADDMSTFLRYMGVEERIVTHCHSKGLDGVKFSKLKDSDLEALSMKNPIICHFRDKSGQKGKGGKKKAPFML